MGETSSGSCPVTGFDIVCFESSGSVTTVIGMPFSSANVGNLLLSWRC
jgi:hypothetical protein